MTKVSPKKHGDPRIHGNPTNDKTSTIQNNIAEITGIAYAHNDYRTNTHLWVGVR